MTLHIIVGDGEMPKAEVKHQLDDLFDRAEKEDTDFWFLIEAKPCPTATDLAVLDYLHTAADPAVHYQLVARDPGGYDAAAYPHSQGVWSPTRGSYEQYVIDTAKSLTSESAEAISVLALFVNVEQDDDADNQLVDFLMAATDAGLPTFALNDSMEAIVLKEEDEPEEPVAPPVAEKPKRNSKKKDPEPEPETLADSVVDVEVWDRVYLEGLRVTELRPIAAGMGIDTSGADKPTLVDAILGNVGTDPEPEVETTPTPERVQEMAEACQQMADEYEAESAGVRIAAEGIALNEATIIHPVVGEATCTNVNFDVVKGTYGYTFTTEDGMWAVVQGHRGQFRAGDLVRVTVEPL